VATAVQGYLKAVGIDAELEQYARGAWMEVAVGAGWSEGVCYFPYCGFPPGELGTLSIFLPPGAIMFKTMWRPPEVEDLFVKALAETDFETKKALIQQMQKVATDKYAMCCWTLVQAYIYAKQAGVHGDGLGTIAATSWTPSDAWMEE